MAKNWNITEVVKVIKEGTDKESIMDIGRRFPLLHGLVAKMVSGDVEATVELFEAMPEYNTAGKINTRLKDGVVATTSDDAEPTEETAKPAKEAAKPAKKVEEAVEADDDYETVYGSAKKAYDECKARGIEVKTGQKKDFYIGLLRDFDKNAGEPAAVVADAEDDWADEDEATSEYEGLTAQELFKECKKKGIKVEAKKSKEYYIEKLTEEVEVEVKEEKPAKAAKPAKQEKPAKPAPKVEEDEDDDWDI